MKWVAPPLLFSGLIALLSGSVVVLWLGALLAMLFLYCQARILNAAKGIPAWRQKLVVPLMIVTGLTEGAGLLALLAALTGAAPIAWGHSTRAVCSSCPRAARTPK